MKYFVLVLFCIAAVSAQYNRNGGHSGGGYGGHQSYGGMVSGGHHRAGRSLVPLGYSGGVGHMATGPVMASSASYGHSGHRRGRSVVAMPAMGHVAVAPVLVNAGSYGHSGHRMGRSVSIIPVVSHAGVGHISGGYSQGGLYGGHRHARSVVALAPMAGHGYYSGLTSSIGHYGAYAGHGHRMVRSPASIYGGAAVGHSGGVMSVSHGSYSNAGQQRGGMGVHHG